MPDELHAEETVAAFDDAIAKLKRQGVTDMRIEVAWHHYADLLFLKGLSFSATERKSWGSKYERRPLKVYRGRPMLLTDQGSQVVGKRPDGWIVAQIVR